MLKIKRFASFGEIQSIWTEVERSVFHYPFQSWWYNNLFTKHFSTEKDLFILGVYDDTTLLAIGAFEIVGSVVTFLGTKDVSDDSAVVQDITDFGDLLYAKEAEGKSSEIWSTLFDYFQKQGFSAYSLAYVRQDSQTFQVLQNSTISEQVETSPFIILPPTWDEYLATLERKERHELKRKIKRLEQDTAFHLCKDQTIEEDFHEFIRLHRLSDPNKAQFMTDRMEKFFWDMVTTDKDTWQIHFCSLFIDNGQVASVMAFMNSTHTLLYNSGFDPKFSHYSVGLLVKAFLLKKSIEQKKSLYDFLRGNERYKYDLGAKNLPLFTITK